MILAMDIEVESPVESYPVIIGSLLIAASAIGTSAWYMRLKTFPSVAIGVAIATLNPIALLAVDDLDSVGNMFLVFELVSILLCPFVYLLLKEVHTKTGRIQAPEQPGSLGKTT